MVVIFFKTNPNYKEMQLSSSTRMIHFITCNYYLTLSREENTLKFPFQKFQSNVDIFSFFLLIDLTLMELFYNPV